MEESQETKVSSETREEERAEATRESGADRMPTKEEEHSAEEARQEVEPEMGEITAHEQEMAKIGVEHKGEGAIP